MSFSSEVKKEICMNTKDSDCCVVAELFALTFVCASVHIQSSGISVQYTTENLNTAKRIHGILTRILKMDANVTISESRLKKKNSYIITVDNAALLAKILGLRKNFFVRAVPDEDMIRKDCCKLALLRGAFLGCGSVSDPKKSYHAEFVVPSREFAQALQKILAENKINSKTVVRKEHFVIYLNEGDCIAALLTLIGSHSAVLNFENIRAYKEIRNNINRAVNCETANISKTVAASMAQIENIHLIEKTIGLNALSQTLRETAELRIEHPHASLAELCELGGITKSAMNHRLRKLKFIAQELGNNAQ